MSDPYEADSYPADLPASARHAVRMSEIQCRNCGQQPAITEDGLCEGCGWVDGGYHQHPIAGGRTIR